MMPVKPSMVILCENTMGIGRPSTSHVISNGMILKDWDVHSRTTESAKKRLSGIFRDREPELYQINHLFSRPISVLQSSSETFYYLLE